MTQTASSMLGPAPEGMPDPSLAPPQMARAGDPFAALRFVHFLSRLGRNTTHQLRDVVLRLNATYLDWYFTEEVVIGELAQLQSNWDSSYQGDDRIVVDANERGRTLLIVDSTKMNAFFVSQATRLAQACDDELRKFALGDANY